MSPRVVFSFSLSLSLPVPSSPSVSFLPALHSRVCVRALFWSPSQSISPPSPYNTSHRCAGSFELHPRARVAAFVAAKSSRYFRFTYLAYRTSPVSSSKRRCHGGFVDDELVASLTPDFYTVTFCLASPRRRASNLTLSVAEDER